MKYHSAFHQAATAVGVNELPASENGCKFAP